MEITTTAVFAATWFLYFMVYSVLGWAVETVYCSIPQKHFVERGFMSGPYCPIYGFGALIILILLEPYFDFPLYIFLLGTLATTVLEYLTSFVMEKLFHMRWWDYSNHKFNIKGRVCLLNSTLFGLLCLALTLLIHPFVTKTVAMLPLRWLFILSAVLLTAFVIDLIISVHAVIQLDKHLAKLRSEVEALKAEGEEKIRRKKEETEEKLEQWRLDSGDKLEDMRESINQWKQEGEAKIAEIKAANKDKAERLAAALRKPGKYQERRIMRSFPKMRYIDAAKNRSLNELKEGLKHWKKK